VSVVVDTNVVAYYLLATEPFVEEVAAFWRGVDEALAPASWEVELVNVLWLATRSGVVDLAQARHRLELARQLGISSTPVRDLWSAALALAVTSGQPAYDTVFVELALRLEVPLATFDRKLLDVFPQVARRPRELTSKP
jgi:predicted nucleic acid-binding protein